MIGQIFLKFLRHEFTSLVGVESENYLCRKVGVIVVDLDQEFLDGTRGFILGS